MNVAFVQWQSTMQALHCFMQVLYFDFQVSYYQNVRCVSEMYDKDIVMLQVI